MKIYNEYIINEIKHLEELQNIISKSQNKRKEKIIKKINKKIEYLYVHYSRKSEYCLLGLSNFINLLWLKLKMFIFYIYIFIIL